MSASDGLPPPPRGLAHGDVSLRFDGVVPENRELGFAPYYHFRILGPGGEDAGHLNFRVGNSEHVRLYAGHIGYGVHEKFRGNGYALQACLAAAPFVRTVYPEVVITADPDNAASLRTIEKLGAVFVEELAVPPHDPQRWSGSRRKLRFVWTP